MLSVLLPGVMQFLQLKSSHDRDVAVKLCKALARSKVQDPLYKKLRLVFRLRLKHELGQVHREPRHRPARLRPCTPPGIRAGHGDPGSSLLGALLCDNRTAESDRRRERGPARCARRGVSDPSTPIRTCHRIRGRGHRLQ